MISLQHTNSKNSKNSTTKKSDNNRKFSKHKQKPLNKYKNVPEDCVFQVEFEAKTSCQRQANFAAKQCQRL
jgi:hypothetical protein